MAFYGILMAKSHQNSMENSKKYHGLKRKLLTDSRNFSNTYLNSSERGLSIPLNHFGQGSRKVGVWSSNLFFRCVPQFIAPTYFVPQFIDSNQTAIRMSYAGSADERI